MPKVPKKPKPRIPLPKKPPKVEPLKKVYSRKKKHKKEGEELLNEVKVPVLCANKPKPGPPEGTAYTLTILVADSYMKEALSHPNPQEAAWAVVKSLKDWWEQIGLLSNP